MSTDDTTRRDDDAVELTLRTITETLGGIDRGSAVRRIGERLFVVKQGSAYVLLNVQALGPGQALVRLAAQVVTGFTMTGALAERLLRVNARLRFGAFGYRPEGGAVILSHAMLGGEALTPEALLAALEDLARLADEFDDRLVAVGGGARMADLLQDEAVMRLRQAEETTREGTAAWDDDE